MSVHSCLGIGYLGGCLNDLIEFSHNFRVHGGQLLSGLLNLAALLEGYDDPIFNHVEDRVADIAEPSNKIPKRFIGSLDTCE